MTQEHEESPAAVLARIDERTLSMQKGMEVLSGEVKSLKEDMVQRYVTQEEFKPVKSVTYGMVKVVLTAVILGLLGLLGIAAMHK